MPDAAHLVGGKAEILPRVFLGDVGDTQSLVKVLKLGLVRWEVPTFLVPCDVWCWARRGTKQETETSELRPLCSSMEPGTPRCPRSVFGPLRADLSYTEGWLGCRVSEGLIEGRTRF